MHRCLKLSDISVESHFDSVNFMEFFHVGQNDSPFEYQGRVGGSIWQHLPMHMDLNVRVVPSYRIVCVNVVIFCVIHMHRCLKLCLILQLIQKPF